MVGRCSVRTLYCMQGRRDPGQGGSKINLGISAFQRGSIKGSKRQLGRNVCQNGPT